MGKENVWDNENVLGLDKIYNLVTVIKTTLLLVN